jgi:hypothetical protein
MRETGGCPACTLPSRPQDACIGADRIGGTCEMIVFEFGKQKKFKNEQNLSDVLIEIQHFF